MAVIGGCLVIAYGAIFVTLFFARDPYVQLSVRTQIVEFETSSGDEIAWELPPATYIDCQALAEVGAGHRGRSDPGKKGKPEDDGPTLLLHGAGEQQPGGLSAPPSTFARVTLDADDATIALEAAHHVQGGRTIVPAGACTPTGAVSLVRPNGPAPKRTKLPLPALFRIPDTRLRPSLTLEFRGPVVVGADVTNSRQPLLLSGNLGLREVRSNWLKAWFPPAQFEADNRELHLGDKVVIRPEPAAGPLCSTPPRGFAHIRPGDKGPEMELQVTAPACMVSVVRAFGVGERPRANWLRQIAGDPFIVNMTLALSTLWGLGRIGVGWLERTAARRGHL